MIVGVGVVAVADDEDRLAGEVADQVRAGLRYIASVPELWISFAMLLIVVSIVR